MPKYEGKFCRCPLCGEPGAAQTVKGDVRYVCGRCYSAILSELVVLRAAADPVGWRERLARLATTVAGGPLEERPEVADPRPSTAKPVSEGRLDMIVSYLRQAGEATAKQIDSTLRFKKGTAVRALRKLAEEKVVTWHAGGQRGTAILWAAA